MVGTDAKKVNSSNASLESRVAVLEHEAVELKSVMNEIRDRLNHVESGIAELKARFDGLEKRVNDRFESFERRVDERFSGLEKTMHLSLGILTAFNVLVVYLLFQILQALR
ncbi:MAG: hypothetical protein QXQ28_02015 [Candidatus Nezhaarchaeales archaeon]